MKVPLAIPFQVASWSSGKSRGSDHTALAPSATLELVTGREEYDSLSKSFETFRQQPKILRTRGAYQ